MFNKKFLLFVILLTLVFSAGYTQTSLYKSPKKLYVITTKYFDIIFPQESTESANLLAQKADDMYLEICEKLDSSPYFRIPVVITPEIDTLNAYLDDEIGLEEMITEMETQRKKYLEE